MKSILLALLLAIMLFGGMLAVVPPQFVDASADSRANPVLMPVLSNDPAAEPTVEEIVARSLEASAKVGTLKLNMDMVMVMEFPGVAEVGKITTTINATSMMDNVKREMQTLMTTSMDGLPGMPKFDTNAQVYIVGGWMYMKMNLPGMGDQWFKSKVSEEAWKKQQSQVSPYGEWLKTAAQVNVMGTEVVDGTPCYAIEVVPDMLALFKWMAEQQPGALKDKNPSDLAQIFKKMSVKEWIAADSYLVRKAGFDMLMEISGPPENQPQAAAIATNATMTFYDYGLPVSVVLPAEAANAIEIPAP